MADVRFNDGHNRFRREVQSTVNQAQARFVYGVTYLVLVSQLVISIVVSVVTWDAPCDSRLQLWLVGHIVRCAIYLPVTRYEQLYFGRPDYEFNHRCFRTSKLLFEIAALLWFVLGNSYVFGAVTCMQTAPLLYGTCFAWMITGYIGLGLPLLFCLSLVFCFPCVYVLLQHFSEVVVPPAPDLEKRINAVPVAKYVPGMFVDPEDAKCIVCLEEYQPGVELRVLPCKHHFHKTCADGWFRMKPHCPLCHAELDGSRAPPEERAGRGSQHLPFAGNFPHQSRVNSSVRHDDALDAPREPPQIGVPEPLQNISIASSQEPNLR